MNAGPRVARTEDARAMYACICRAVTEHDVRDAVDRGAPCVRSVCKETGAASECGSCFSRVRSIVREAAHRPERVLAAVTTS